MLPLIIEAPNSMIFIKNGRAYVYHFDIHIMLRIRVRKVCTCWWLL
jgi:hypothetical protein